jgi:hypothetical protein
MGREGGREGSGGRGGRRIRRGQKRERERGRERCGAHTVGRSSFSIAHMSSMDKKSSSSLQYIITFVQPIEADEIPPLRGCENMTWNLETRLVNLNSCKFGYRQQTLCKNVRTATLTYT